MANSTIVIEFDGDLKKLKAKLKNIDKDTTKTGKNFGAKLAAGAKAAAGPLAIAAAAITAVGVAMGGLVNEAAKIEDVTTQFEVLTGSASKASAVVKDLQDFSASTPFQFDGIAKASQQLLGFGFSAEELVPRLKEIGDVASAVGRPIEEVGFIFGQVAAAGKLTGERLLQFQERAIPIGPAIAKTMGIAESAVKEAVTAGKVDLETFQKAFASMSQVGGFAFEGMIKQSKTFSGLMSTVGDNVKILAADIGKELLPAAKSLATAFLTLLQGTRDFLKEDDDAVEMRMKSLREEMVRVENGIDSLQAKQKEDGGLNKIAEARLTERLARQKEIQAIFDQQEQDKIDEKNADKLAKEKATNKALEQSKLDSKKESAAMLEELETELAEIEFENEEAKQARLKEITDKYLAKEYDAKRELAKEDIKAALKENKLKQKEELKYGTGIAKMKAFFRDEEVKGTMKGLEMIATLTESGNKTLVRIGKAAAIARAIMNTAQGVTSALAEVPYPLNFAAAAAVGIAGAAQIAKISSTGFAQGGLVEGGTPGRDSVSAMLSPGEIVAPRQNFEEVIGSVRAQREANALTDESAASSLAEVVISFKDDVGEFIEATILERRVLGVGAV